MRYLTLISSRLDAGNAEEAGRSLALTPNRDGSSIIFLHERNNLAMETARRIQEPFARRPCASTSCNVRSLWMIETDEGHGAAEKLWPWIAAALSQNTATSFAIVAEPAICYGLAREYYREAEKDFPDWACHSEIGLLTINTQDHEIQYSLTLN